MKAGIGYAQEKNAYQCGYQAALRAMEAGSGPAPSYGLSFCTNDVDIDEFRKGLRAAFGNDAVIAGFTAVGVIANEGLSYTDSAAAVLALQCNKVKIRAASVFDSGENEKEAGMTLAKELGALPDDKVLLLFYDMVKKVKKQDRPLEMTSMLSILSGLTQGGAAKIPIFGGGLMGTLKFDHSVYFDNDRTGSNYAAGLVIGGDCGVYSAGMHGCTPFDGAYHAITKKDGAAILELDGQPVDALIDEIYQSRDWRNELPITDLTIAKNFGPKYAPCREADYINRIILGPAAGEMGIRVPEQDWQVGADVQFMIRDNEEMLASAEQNSAALLRRIKADGRTPLLGIYVDCAGRTASFSNSGEEEAALVQREFNEHNIPLIGVYSGFELATVDGECVGREWTGLLIVITHSEG